MRAVLFPGQGSQYVGMGSDFYEQFESVKKIFETVDKTLGFPLSNLILNGPEEELKLTKNTQPAIMTIGVSIFNVLREHFNLNLNRFKIFCWTFFRRIYSSCLCRIIEYRKAAYLLHERGKAMQESVPTGQGAMTAILGMTIMKLKKKLVYYQNKKYVK